MCKLCWTLLLGAVVAVVIAFMMCASGNKTPIAVDGRQVIVLEPQQRDLMLTEMRAFVDSLRDITMALGTNDKKMFLTATLRVGLKAQEGVPLDQMKALPLAFKKLGMDTHQKFDDLAALAEQGASQDELLTELGHLLNKCVACHEAYQLVSQAPTVAD